MDHSTTFTPDELRKALKAMAVIARYQKREELDYRIQEAWRGHSDWLGLGPQTVAMDVASLLHADRDTCDQAAQDVFAPQYPRIVFEVLVQYADQIERERAEAERWAIEQTGLAHDGNYPPCGLDVDYCVGCEGNDCNNGCRTMTPSAPDGTHPAIALANQRAAKTRRRTR